VVGTVGISVNGVYCVSGIRSALREFALGIEALRRFVEREPLRRVYECSFAVLAL
jgi:protein phosphatase